MDYSEVMEETPPGVRQNRTPQGVIFYGRKSYNVVDLLSDDPAEVMAHPLVEKAKSELEQAQSQLDGALRAWDASVSELWRSSLALTQAQRRVTHAHELLREALGAKNDSKMD
jgi:hypothetical protein